jgi:hypothetical protein
LSSCIVSSAVGLDRPSALRRGVDMGIEPRTPARLFGSIGLPDLGHRIPGRHSRAALAQNVRPRSPI